MLIYEGLPFILRRVVVTDGDWVEKRTADGVAYYFQRSTEALSWYASWAQMDDSLFLLLIFISHFSMFQGQARLPQRGGGACHRRRVRFFLPTTSIPPAGTNGTYCRPSHPHTHTRNKRSVTGYGARTPMRPTCRRFCSIRGLTDASSAS